METKWSFAIFVVFLTLAHGELLVKLTKGKIKGQILKSRDGRPYYSFMGIPYAKPPIGELRFKAPEPVEPWNGTLDATKESNICIQEGSKIGHEDCLYLNVYTPKTHAKLLPILFWIYGGAFTWGHSRSSYYGPEYFMDKDVVIVTMHYRHGIFGFLSTEDDVIPGNYGLKDQVEAMRWVRENILEFNGDPNRVTIAGGSAGGICVGFHMMSLMSKGLFHKAILQSGTPAGKVVIFSSGTSRKRAYALATIAGCKTDTSKQILDCLRKLPAPYLMDIHTKLFAWKNTYPSALFTPVMENCISGQEGFLCDNLANEFKQESFVPTIIGMNSAEGGLYVSRLFNETSLTHTEFRIYFNRIFSYLIYLSNTMKPDKIDEICEKVLKKYFSSGSIDDNSHMEVVKMFTDWFITRILDMSYRLSSPVYSYLYDYQNEFTYNTVLGSCKKNLGVTHGDELTSLFKMNDINPKDLNGNDLKMSRLMVKIWYKFINSDNPTIDGSEDGLPWPKFTRSNQTMLYLNSIYPSCIQNPLLENYDFWYQL